MKGNIKIILLVFLSLQYFSAFADEGMWIPSLLAHYNIDIMQGKGLKLSAEDIYSINQASLKDAVVIFGRGCTGVMVSSEGLLLTNHHCGYSSVQILSTVENDYLTNGFWAMNRDEELPVPGLTVTFLVRIEDVTYRVLEGTGAEITESQLKDKINQNIKKISEEVIKDTHYKTQIKPFFYGNEYYMFVYEEYNDIRMVGAPPSSIGNFGSDPDNWMWPRHTGDFSIFRVYADHSNKPASYSPDNIPYEPKKFLPISTAGLENGDLTFVMGYPGTTTEYLISPAVEMIYKSSLPHKIKLREKRMEIMKKYMGKSDQVRIQYAAKYRSVSNAWKKWQGVVRGLERMDAVALRKEQEEEFQQWAESDDNRKQQYGSLLPSMLSLYEELNKYSLAYDYYQECHMATEIFNILLNLGGMITRTRGEDDTIKVLAKNQFLSQAEEFFKNYYSPIDIEIFSNMIRFYYEDIDTQFHPALFQEIQRKYKGDYALYAKTNFRKSILADYEGISSLLENYPEKESTIVAKIIEDPLYKIFSSFSSIFNEKIFGRYEFLSDEIDRNYRTYVKGIREKEPDSIFYPDANFTMRLSYGKAEGYKPADAIFYNYFTTLDGKIEKFRTGSEDYSLPDKLIRLYETKDYGRWADKSGHINTCFLSSHHTSGGNSGSPVINASGHLTGLHFDRNWEGTISDIVYDPSQCRSIALDIRYVLFIIEKFAGAGYLLEEMIIIN